MPTSDKGGSDPAQRFRQPKGIIGVFAKTTLGIIPIIGTVYVTHLPEYLNIAIYKEQYLGLILSLLLLATYLIVPPTKTASRESVPWYDAILVVLTMITGGYVVFYYPKIIPTLGYLMTHRILMGAI
ncbi:MAG: hypothetical protein JSV55_11460, partial [Deltaproteobacteria bacterium]